MLITLGIIGIVAAMTLPALINNLDKRQNLSSLKKFYANLMNVNNQIYPDYGFPKDWNLINDLASADRIAEMYIRYFKILKKCNHDNNSCFPVPVKTRTGEIHIKADNVLPWESVAFQLSDGTSILIDANENWFSLFVDVNGFRKPNTLGEDVFVFAIDADGKISENGIDGKEGDYLEYAYAYNIMKNGWQMKY